MTQLVTKVDDVSGHNREYGGVLLARQPIFDNCNQLVGYELLCRSPDKKLSNAQATADVMVNIFSEVKIEDVIGDNLCFINFSSDILHVLLPLVNHRVVIEILEFTTVDDELINNVKKLKEKGYLIALDDFDINSDLIKLVPYADIVKLDVLELGMEKTERSYKLLRENTHLQLLAEKVEDHETYLFCQELGFDTYQGYFFSKPDLIHGKRVKKNKQVLLRLMAMVNQPDVEVSEIEKILIIDPVLSFKMLRLVNSTGIGLTNKVESLKHALAIIGLERLRSWLMLLSLANLSSKPDALCLKALEYAKMSEQLAAMIYGHLSGKNGFSLGLFALLDAFLDVSMDEVVSSMTLTHEFEQALLGREGEYGKLLAVVEATQEGRWNDLNEDYLEYHGINFEQLMRVQWNAQRWAEDTMSTVSGL